MIQTTVRLERPEGTVLMTGIAVQIEQLGMANERVEFEGARPFDLFVVYTTQGVPSVALRRRDVLFDERNTDAETLSLAKYRVTGQVETFETDHQEALCERVVGK